MNIGFIERETFRGDTEIVIVRTEVPNMQAEMAERLMQQLAIVAASEDGEDSTGRQKLRLMEPAEVAQRACDIAAAAWEEFHKREWILAIPMPKAEQARKEAE